MIISDPDPTYQLISDPYPEKLKVSDPYGSGSGSGSATLIISLFKQQVSCIDLLFCENKGSFPAGRCKSSSAGSSTAVPTGCPPSIRSTCPPFQATESSVADPDPKGSKKLDPDPILSESRIRI